MKELVAIYGRLSEEDRDKRKETDDSQSIQNQKALLIQYANERNWLIYDIYTDDDYTGSDRGRPEWNRLLQDAKERKFNIVLCKTQSRFTRELEMVEKYIHGLFPLWGIRFVSVVDNADTEIKGNKKSRQINGLINEWYLEDMSENIKSVLTNRRTNGFHIGSFALYGYQKDPEAKGHLIIDEEAAPIVREVFELFAKGYGKSAIARMLNDRGLPNPTEYKRLKGLRYKQPPNVQSTLWKYNSISTMLVNEIYIGNMVQGKYGSVSYKTKQNKPIPKEKWIRVEGTHEPIIDIELWNRVQNLTRQKAKAFVTGKIGLFARKVRCADCGYIMRSSKNRGKHYLKCSTKYASKDACEGAFASVNTLGKMVIAEINKLSENYLEIDSLQNKISFGEPIIAKKEQIQDNLKSYHKNIDECDRDIKTLYLDKLNGVITDIDFLNLSREFNQERKRLEGVIAEYEQSLKEVETKLKSSDSRKQLVEQYTNLTKLHRETVDTLIDCIYIGRRKSRTSPLPIEIHWNF